MVLAAVVVGLVAAVVGLAVAVMGLVVAVMGLAVVAAGVAAAVVVAVAAVAEDAVVMIVALELIRAVLQNRASAVLQTSALDAARLQ